MDRQLLTDLLGYLSRMQRPTEEEQDLLKRLTAELPYFHITSLDRDILFDAGFDASDTSDGYMESLACYIAEHLDKEAFIDTLIYVVEHLKELPRLCCPECEDDDVSYDFDEKHYQCHCCGHDWPKEDAQNKPAND